MTNKQKFKVRSTPAETDNHYISSFLFPLKDRNGEVKEDMEIAFVSSVILGREHYLTVREQTLKQSKLCKYSQSLFDSCFKHW